MQGILAGHVGREAEIALLVRSELRFLLDDDSARILEALDVIRLIDGDMAVGVTSDGKVLALADCGSSGRCWLNLSFSAASEAFLPHR